MISCNFLSAPRGRVDNCDKKGQIEHPCNFDFAQWPSSRKIVVELHVLLCFLNSSRWPSKQREPHKWVSCVHWDVPVSVRKDSLPFDVVWNHKHFAENRGVSCKNMVVCLFGCVQECRHACTVSQRVAWADRIPSNMSVTGRKRSPWGCLVVCAQSCTIRPKIPRQTKCHRPNQVTFLPRSASQFSTYLSHFRGHHKQTNLCVHRRWK